MKKLIFVFLILFSYSSTAFFISAKNSCGNNVYSYEIGEYVSFADIKIRVGPNVSSPDYKLYYNSSLFSANEAAGLFLAIWKFNIK